MSHISAQLFSRRALKALRPVLSSRPRLRVSSIVSPAYANKVLVSTLLFAFAVARGGPCGAGVADLISVPRESSAGPHLFHPEEPWRDEHLAGMAIAEVGVRCMVVACRKRNGSCMESSKGFLETWSRCLGCNDDLPIRGQGKRALVKQAVVERAERERVRDDVGSSGTVPLDVGCLEPDRLLVQVNGVPAQGASVAIGGKHPGGKLAVAGLSVRRDVCGVDAHSIEYLPVKRRGKVSVGERVCNLSCEVRVSRQCLVDVVGEAGVDVVVEE